MMDGSANLTKCDPRFTELSDALKAHADACDADGAWPRHGLRAFGEAGGWRWTVARDHGGDDLAPEERIAMYMALGRGDVSTALIVTQRDGAVDLITNGDNDGLKSELLPACAAGEHFTTVGIAQLTTSRQGAEPAMTAEWQGDLLELDGIAPWATGADHADSVVIGAVLSDGDHVLASVPTEAEGMSVEAPMTLAALNASHTSAVRCAKVRVPRSRVILGPRENVMSRRSPVKNWVSSSVGVGLAMAMLDEIEKCRAKLPEGLVAVHDELRCHVEDIRSKLLGFAGGNGDVEKPVVHDMRMRINDLLIRLAGVMMLAVKGSGYMAGRTPQRLAREALFFCVWSAPDNIRDGTATRLISGMQSGDKRDGLVPG